MRGRRAAALAAAAVLVAAAAVGAWLLWPAAPEPPPAGPATSGEEEVALPPPRLDLAPARFADLPGWGEDDAAGALAAFRRSCAAWSTAPPERPLGAVSYGGTVGDWRGVCSAAAEVAPGADAARRFFETGFVPWAASDHGAAEGLFTGYYEPTLHGSRRRGGAYTVPLHTRPPELVSVDLGGFRDDLRGRRIAGRLEGSRLVPFADRREIEAGELAGRGLELLWVDDPVDAFFLHIQGSGVVEMDDGTSVRVGYADQNGHPYVAIGKVLVERGAMALEDVSMQSLRSWLEEHAGEADEVMAANPSYVFFRRLETEGPLGAQGVVVTPGRSLAVDLAFHALGVPVWLDASAPAADPAAADRPLRRLLVAQDTGGAIRGPVRGDVFWGAGDDAAAIAGRMKHRGRMWVLLPAGLPPPAAAAGDAGRG